MRLFPCPQAPLLLLPKAHGAPFDPRRRRRGRERHRCSPQVTPKPFAMGFRIEHPQELIDWIQYGPDIAGLVDRGTGPVPVAEYKLTAQVCRGQPASDAVLDLQRAWLQDGIRCLLVCFGWLGQPETSPLARAGPCARPRRQAAEGHGRDRFPGPGLAREDGAWQQQHEGVSWRAPCSCSHFRLCCPAGPENLGWTAPVTRNSCDAPRVTARLSHLVSLQCLLLLHVPRWPDRPDELRGWRALHQRHVVQQAEQPLGQLGPRGRGSGGGLGRTGS